MHYIKIPIKKAESMKALLLRNALLDRKRKVMHSTRYVYFPVISIDGAKTKKLIESSYGAIIDREGSMRTETEDYKSMLSAVLDADEMKELTSGYDLLGNIAIIDVSDKLAEKEALIAKAILASNKSITTVIAKAGAVSGIYRVRKFRYVSGKRTYNATYRENGSIFVFDVRKTFFSNRLSYERSRINALVKKAEHVAVPFAGVGPFAIEIAKAHPDAKVIAIELNGDAYKAMVKNIVLNKTSNVKAYLGNVKSIAKRHASWADRVVMPTPKTSMDFLDDALVLAKRVSTVHIYLFCAAEGGIKKAKDAINAHAKANSYHVRFNNVRVVRPYSKDEIEIVIDYTIRKKDQHI